MVRFKLGQPLATPGALKAAEGKDLIQHLCRDASGDRPTMLPFIAEHVQALGAVVHPVHPVRRDVAEDGAAGEVDDRTATLAVRAIKNPRAAQI
jgi:hypothetical protein